MNTTAFTTALRELAVARAEVDEALSRLASIDRTTFDWLAAHARDVRSGRVAMTPDGTGLLAAAKLVRELRADVERAIKNAEPAHAAGEE